MFAFAHIQAHANGMENKIDAAAKMFYAFFEKFFRSSIFTTSAGITGASLHSLKAG